MSTTSRLVRWAGAFVLGIVMAAQVSAAPMTFTVTNTNDSGSGSLRAAVALAEANPGTDTIAFNIPGSGPHTIQIQSVFYIWSPVVIDGYTQPGASPNTVAVGNNAVIKIELDGSDAPNGTDGLVLLGGASTVRGLSIYGFSAGILLQQLGGNVVEGNFIGTDASGLIAKGNKQFGVRMWAGSGQNRIGTNGDGVTDEGERNIIAANGEGDVMMGLYLYLPYASSDNVIAGNYIGTDKTGETVLDSLRVPDDGIGNLCRVGVWIQSGSSRNRVGTNGDGIADAAERNIIAGHLPNGIYPNGDPCFHNAATQISINHAAQDNVVAGNYLGTDVTGTVALSPGSIGMRLLASTGNRIGTNGDGISDALERNIVSQGANGLGIHIQAENNVVAGNYVGTDVTGTVALGNRYGIHMITSTGNRIGGLHPSERNVVSGNTEVGVSHQGGGSAPALGEGTVILGNFIGVDVTGKRALPNGDGVRLNGVANNTLGGAATGAGNVISGNTGFGVYTVIASSNLIQGNMIGVDVDGALALGNGNDGVILDRGSSGNAISGNVISNSGGSGVAVQGIAGQSSLSNLIQGNFIGTDATGSLAMGNTGPGVRFTSVTGLNTVGGASGAASNRIAHNGGAGVLVQAGEGHAVLGNSIFANGGLGIDLGGGGVTPNDPNDTDGGTNRLQNYPALTTAAGGNVSLILNSAPNTQFRVEFFANAQPDASGFGEGQTFIGFTNVTTDAAGNAAIASALSIDPARPFIAATATDPSGNTSEFSSVLLATGLQADLQPTMLSVPGAAIESGRAILTAGTSVSVQVTIANHGAAAASGMVDKSVFSTDSVVGNGDDLAEVPGGAYTIPAAGSYSGPYTQGLPTTPGNYNLCYLTDSTLEVAESDETNNTLCIPVTVRAAGVSVPEPFTVTPFATNVSPRLAGMTFDSSGNLLVADKNSGYDCSTTDGRVLSFTPSGVMTLAVGPHGLLQDAAGVAFGTGNEWGSHLYLVDENNGGCLGGIFRVESNGDLTTLKTGSAWGMGYSNNSRLAFGRGGAFGTNMYVADFANGGDDGFGYGNSGGVYTLASDGTTSVFKFGAPFVDPYDLEFGPGGAWGSDMYVADYGNFGGTGYVWRVDPAGNATMLAGGPSSPFVSPNDIAFGPGGSFGTDLYVRDFDAGQIFRVSPAGVVTTFISGLTNSSSGVIATETRMHGGMAFDPSGSCLYVVDDNNILKICGATAGVPDLAVTSVTTSALSLNTAQPNTTLTVNGTVANVGGSASVGHMDRVAILTANRQPLDSDTAKVGIYYFAEGVIEPGDTYSMSVVIPPNFLASLAPGEYFVCYEANWNHGDMTEPNYGDNWSCTPMTITNTTTPEPADVGLEKNASTTSVVAGAELTFFVNVKNFGPGPATQVVFNDAMPANFEVVSVSTDRGTCVGVGTSTANCAIGNMAAPSPALDIVHIVIVARAKAPGIVTNTATVGHGGPDPNPGNDAGSSEVITIQPAFAGLGVDKRGRVLSDGRLEFTITILNLKTTPARNVKAQDTLQPDLRLVSVRSDDPTATCPADPDPNVNIQFVQCVLPTLAGSSAWQVVIVAEVMRPGPVENTAIGIADDLEPGTSTPRKTFSLPSGPPPRLIKSLEGAFYTGGVGTYRFTVTAPFGAVAGPIWVTDHLPAGLTFVSSSSTGGFVCTAAGQDVTCKRPTGLPNQGVATILLQVNVNVPAGQDVVNRGILLWPGGSGGSEVTHGVGAPPLVIRKTVAPPQFGRLVYTIDALNSGPVAVNHVTITDDLPPTVRFVSAAPANLCHGPDPVVCDLGTLQPGQTAQAVITVEYLMAGQITNSARIDADGVPGAVDTVRISTPAPTDLKAEKEVSTPEVIVGDELRYTLRVRNLGPRVAQYAQVIDPIPAGLQVTSIVPDAGMTCSNPPVPFIVPHTSAFRLICSTQNLGVLAFKQVVITVRALTTGPLANTITVEGPPGDPVPGNNSAGPVTTTVRGITLGDRVWKDADGDGVQESGEGGIGGVVVNLLSADGAFLTSTITGSDGSYQFDVLARTTYRVEIAASNFATGGVLRGFTGTTGGEVQTKSTVTTSVGTADFGYVALTIGDRVWYDADGDGVQDGGEAGIAGVVVNLKDASGALLATTTTGSNGSYRFGVLRNTTYQVQIAASNFATGGVLRGFRGTTTGLDRQTKTIGTTSVVTVDFGYDRLPEVCTDDRDRDRDHDRRDADDRKRRYDYDRDDAKEKASAQADSDRKKAKDKSSRDKIDRDLKSTHDRLNEECQRSKDKVEEDFNRKHSRPKDCDDQHHGDDDQPPYEFPDEGQFVIGDRTNHAVGQTVYYWGAQWDKNNPMSVGPGTTAFKGFDDNSAVPTCGGTWTTRPGNSSNPPNSVPPYMAIIVSSKVSKSGSTISGDVKEILIIKTNSGYDDNPGHPGTGVVVAKLCGS